MAPGMLDGITEYVKQSLKDRKIFMYRAAFCCYKYGRLQSDNCDHDDKQLGCVYYKEQEKGPDQKMQNSVVHYNIYYTWEFVSQFR